jgi:glycosyltransferase involved in cell wall biosynthesis
MIVFVASTVDARLGGIARSVPALAQAVAEAVDEPVLLLAPQTDQLTLDPSQAGPLQVRLCDGFDGVKRELQGTVSQPGGVRYIYHAGIWNNLNHSVARLGRRHGIPVIVSTRSMLDPWALQYHGWRKRIAWWLYARRDMLQASAIHATAELEAGYIRSALGANCPKVIMVPNGIHLPPASALDAQPAMSPRRLLFLSRIHPKKGITDLIHAFGELKPAGWELLIAGNDDGGHLAECERLAAQQPNAAAIRFIGSVPDSDKWELYRSATCFVLPSYSENFGLVIGEALACNVPVLTTTATPWAEFAGADSESLGLHIIPPGQAPLLARLRQLLQSQSIPCHSAPWIQTNFSWPAIGTRFVEAVSASHASTKRGK